MKHYLLTLLLSLAATTTYSQEPVWYDLTSEYLVNADFSQGIKHGLDDTENSANKVEAVTGWKADVAEDVSVSGATFAYGTQATFISQKLPQVGPDGNAEGGCLALSATLKAAIVYYQDVKLPAGNYMLVVPSQKLNEKSQKGTSPSGWWASETENFLSVRDSFPTGEWINDTIRFELSEVTKGRLQVGLKSDRGTALRSAVQAIDCVRLLRDTPFSDDDEMTLTPEVANDMRFARGATMAFGRILCVEGSDVEEQGFCWATHPTPTIEDNHTTEHLSNSGYIYWLKDLQPATMYYMRAYAKTKTGRVGYGEDIKFCTIPKGNITYWYNNGGDEAANNRVNKAAAEACDIFSNLMNVSKHFNIGYSAGTPTADCYYADEPWMNMGANASYQRTGTIMHEMQHGLGVIPYSTQWNKNNLRERLDGEGRGTGHWLGDRVSEFLDFWDNTTGSQLNGDYQHMWPYGINGANEDNGKKELYFANALIGQALGEDGLEHHSQTFANPCYIFTQEDDVKYYLTNEAEDRGRDAAFLAPDATGKLSWRNMTVEEALQDDNAAWYISFTPSNQYYQLRNVATGQYLTYSSGAFRAQKRTTLTSNEDIHLMKGRVDVGKGAMKRRGFWLVHPSPGNWTPPCMTANANNVVGPSTFNIANSSTRQRWIIMTAEDLTAIQVQTGISEPAVCEEPAKADANAIYTLDGRRLQTAPSALRPGIYIVNGKKTVVK